MYKKKKFSSFIPPKPNRTSIGNDPLASSWNRSTPQSPLTDQPSVDPEEETEIELSEKQARFFDLIAQRECVLISGAAGTGIDM